MLVLARVVRYRALVRWLLTWVVWLGVSACGSAQYEARSSYDKTEEYSAAAVEAPPMAPEAPSPGYESGAVPESFEVSDPVADSDESWSDDGAEGALAGSSSKSRSASAPTAQRAPGELIATQMSASDTRAPLADRPGTPAVQQPVAEPAPSVGEKPTSEVSQQLPKQLLLIYRAQLVLAVFETRVTLDKIELLARQLGGYLVQRSNDFIEVRVPVAQFEQALKDSAALGDEISRQVTAEDVSDRYRDLKIRLHNAEVVRERLAALLARATDVKEALLVEEQLGRVTTTIEQIKGKLKVLDELIAFSTVTVHLQSQVSHEKLNQRVTLPFPWLRDLGLSNLLYLEER